MTQTPPRVFLDTNVYIIGVAHPLSPEATLLEWMGFGGERTPGAEVIISEPLVAQILRVGRRVGGKDWGSQILSRIWREMAVQYVMLDDAQVTHLRQSRTIPREDVEMYLTAVGGRADCFVSANRELVRAIATATGSFECMDAGEFVSMYLSG